MIVVLAVTLAATIALCALAYGLGRLVGGIGARTRRRRRRPEPEGRPIEAIVADLRRLGTRFHGLDPRTSFAKVEAVRSAYDRSLTECCAALGITHLLGVLPAGPELDAERERVEEQLAGCGVRFPHAA
jgi:hypothetical protein